MKIKKNVIELVNKCNSRNVYDICSCLDIEIIKHDLNNIKGYYTSLEGQKAIILNNRLPYEEEEIVLAHELGHINLHSNSNICFLTNYTYSNTNKFENQANKFALMVSDNDLLEIKEMNFNLEQMACYFRVPLELLEFKFNHKI
ncbi:ImmA/IrrE family metallo-endopeptidase [Metaclostridioides mangenotii]|uniref:Zn-dependent peptidase ImmA (M78 family) n=1 Tax=Metaclostridioides mangenotii TaxID=1540 RepID=A0ABS4E6Y6_9FIRM|nr:ImmA/IrrE family metallo-endopeptidase [Clostridioides mangenotii]MBP1853684.1 Zn-dependent peptidase ImmA (M78 family) [Clostridioides mangenotii]